MGSDMSLGDPRGPALFARLRGLALSSTLAAVALVACTLVACSWRCGGMAAAQTLSPPSAPAMQRAVLYEEDPTEPRGKAYVGSVTWRVESVTLTTGAASELVVRADIEIPERRLAAKLLFRHNTDPALPASHTVEITFDLPGDFTPGRVENVPGILMKPAEQSRGIPLAGLSVKVTTSLFLIGLSSVEADTRRNLSLLKEQRWFDIPIIYDGGRRAILALEKGTPGEKAFDEALKAWGPPAKTQAQIRENDGRVPQQPMPPASGAEKALLYEEDPADPAGKSYSGSVVWRMATPAPGVTGDPVIQADVDIPERGMRVSLSFRRNADAAVPASHVIEISFDLPSNFPPGSVQNVPGILMKPAAQARGAPLAGLAMKSEASLFTIRLATAETERQRNLQLLKERPWFDVPVIYQNGRRAILAIEKGPSGEEAFEAALKAWGR
jgi:hypothetical protein